MHAEGGEQCSGEGGGAGARMGYGEGGAVPLSGPCRCAIKYVREVRNRFVRFEGRT